MLVTTSGSIGTWALVSVLTSSSGASVSFWRASPIVATLPGAVTVEPWDTTVPSASIAPPLTGVAALELSTLVPGALASSCVVTLSYTSSCSPATGYPNFWDTNASWRRVVSFLLSLSKPFACSASALASVPIASTLVNSSCLAKDSLLSASLSWIFLAPALFSSIAAYSSCRVTNCAAILPDSGVTPCASATASLFCPGV